MDSNRVRFALLQEATPGVSPAVMRMRQMRITKDALKYIPKFFVSNEIRPDRMSVDPAKVNEENSGSVDFEMHFPLSQSPTAAMLQSALMNPWTIATEADNNYVAGAVVGCTTSVMTFAPGYTWPVNGLVLQSGFANAQNNALFQITGVTATTYTSLGFAAETAPTTARSKLIGVACGTGDIVATATGLTSTTLDFTTLPAFVAGAWIKIGATARNRNFTAVPANNDWCHIASVAPHALTFDVRPAGWAPDAGTGRSLYIFFGDLLRNGTTLQTLEIQRSYLGQAVPSHVLQKGMQVDQLDLSFASEQAITATASFYGLSGKQGTVDNASSVDPPTTSAILTGNVSVGAIYEGGGVVLGPNWIKTLSCKIANNIRAITAVGNVGAVALGMGEVAGTGTLETYFGSNTQMAKLFAGTISMIAVRASAPNALGQNQAFTLTFPRVTYTDGSANAPGKNQDMTLPMAFVTSIDPVSGCEVQIDRHEYWEP